MNNSVVDLQKVIDLKYKDQTLLENALIHRSYLNENRTLGLVSNERLEFLGDAVLELWTTEKLFKQFPTLPEGDLTNLRSLIVCTENLARLASTINLGHYIRLSRGEESHGGRLNQSILADTFESIIGSLYLDQGYKPVDKFLQKYLSGDIESISSKNIYKDPKSRFQEIAQAKQGITPNYQIIKEAGPDHQKTFEVGAYIGDKLIATGSGNSKQKAEESAAISATKILSNI